jgi:hypothetical protein
MRPYPSLTPVVVCLVTVGCRVNQQVKQAAVASTAAIRIELDPKDPLAASR